MSTITENPLQAAIEAVNEAVGHGADDSQRIVAAKVRGLLVGYDARWRDVPWVNLSSEEVFHVPVCNPETGATSRTFTHAGKYDGIIRYQPTGQTYLREHKTCSEDIEDPNTTYWRRLVIDSQVSAYMLANWQSERKLDGTMYDVVRKPTISPKGIPKGDTRKKMKIDGKMVPIDAEQQQLNNIGTIEEIKNFGTYLGHEIDPTDCDWLNAGDTEPPELFSIRLAKDTLERPERYFQRRTVPRMDSEIVEFAGELWDVSKAMLEARSNERHYRNSDACTQYGSPCTYLGVCSGHDSLDSDRWQRGGNVHSELPELTEDNGLSVLTNSRIRCFQSCRRKHYFRYELGVRRVDEEEREALFFGTLWHVAMESWWGFFNER